MNKTILLSFVLLYVLNIIGCQRLSEIPSANGEELVRKLWEDFKSTDRKIFENWIAEGFQSIHQDGARDRDDEIQLLMNLSLGKYELGDFITTQNKSVVVVTYSVSVYETIEDKILPATPAERISVFMFDGSDWKWIAHANLNPMDK